MKVTDGAGGGSEAVDEANMTVLANELAPNVWSTDVCRMVNNDHPLVDAMMVLFDIGGRSRNQIAWTTMASTTVGT